VAMMESPAAFTEIRPGEKRGAPEWRASAEKCNKNLTSKTASFLLVSSTALGRRPRYCAAQQENYELHLPIALKLFKQPEKASPLDLAEAQTILRTDYRYWER
jgi:hypothetical protein